MNETNWPQPPSLWPQAASAIEKELYSFRGIPQPPQEVQYTAGSLEACIFWSAPANMEGIAGWRVFKDNETNMVWQTWDANVRQHVVKIPGGATKINIFVCSFSSLGRESPKVHVVAQSLTDKYVVTGTTGETSGSGGTPNSEWQEAPSGGGYNDGDYLLE